MQRTDLSQYQNEHYNTGANALKRTIWHFANTLVFKTGLMPVSGLKRALLRIFGATIGKGVVIKPGVNIKYPWNLSVGEYTWIGENVWIDSLVKISIGAHVCLSQGAVLLTGSHNYKLSTFDLILGPITLEDGVWIGAGAMVNQGVTAYSHAVLTAGSVATKDLEAYTIYQGNPATAIRKRDIEI